MSRLLIADGWKIKFNSSFFLHLFRGVIKLTPSKKKHEAIRPESVEMD